MLVSDSGEDLLIRSTRVNLRIQRHGPGPVHLHPEPPAAPGPSRTPPPPGEEELQTIRLAAGGRGAGLEALRQRSHSAPRRRPVKVTLLDSHNAPGQDAVAHNAPGQDSRSHNAPGQGCNMERVSELTESVQKLLQNHRGQTLTEETLHRLETLHNQQLTLQNQLLDSALSLAVRPQAPPPPAAVPTATLPLSVAPPCRCERAPERPSPRATLEEAGLRPEQVLMEMQRLRAELQAALTQRKEPEKPPPSEETPPRPSRTFQTPPRPSRTFQNPPRPSRTFQNPPRSSRLPVPRPHTRSARKDVRKHDHQRATPGRQPSIEETTQKQQLKDTEARENSDQLLDVCENQENQSEEPENYIQYLQNRIESKQHDPRASGKRRAGEETELEGGGEERGEAQEKERLKERSAALRPELLGLRPELLGLRPELLGLRPDLLGLRPDLLAGPEAPPSALDEARLVLRKVQRQRKVLEENLESQLRARSAELLHCRLDALKENRDCSAEIRMKKAVDSFIRDIQAETEAESAATKANRKEATGRRNPAPQTNKNTAERRNPAPQTNKNTAERRNPAPQTNRNTAERRNPAPQTNKNTAERRNPAPSGRPLRTDAKATAMDPEERLRRLYGKAAHDGQRRSLKRSPYLRLSSPVSPDRSRPRPRLLQSVRGVKLKSCKTQTPGFSPGLDLSPGSVRSGDSFPAMAVPLGRPRTGPAHRAPQEVTSPPRAPPPPPSPPPQREVTSAATPPKEESAAERQEQSSDPPPVVTIQTSPHLQEEEEAEFPGTHFLSVADVEQSDAGSEAAPGGSEELLQLEGGPGPDLVQYQGPQFPPRPPAQPLPSAQEQSLDLGLGLQRDALEQRLVQWVEQQLMSRIICDMSRPPPSDPTHSPYTGQSEPSAASDLGHGDPGLSGPSGPSRLQLQVDSGLDLDEEQVRGLVLEVLTEIVALFLGSRESPDPQTGPEPGPDPGAETGPDAQSLTQTQQTLVPTPEATPPQTPPPAAQTPPLSPVVTPRATPPPSAPPSVKEDPPPEPVATPPPTPPEPPLVEEEEEAEPEAPPLPEPSPAPTAVAPPPGPPSPPDASPSSSSSSSSSGTSVTVPRHISEGELLLSQRHLQALHEENSSFSSSLHELQEMELDPPSEGQVHGRSILLSFISKLQQREPRPPPEGAWGRGLEEEEEVSAGEIKDTGTESAANHSRSPGQASPITGEAFERTNHSALSEGLLTSDLLDLPLAQDHAPKRSDLPPRRSPQEPPQSPDYGVGGAEGGVWADGGPAPLMVDVFVPSAEAAETSGGSDSFSDAF